MRQPRTDRETYPVAMSVQIIKRKPVDQYGREQAGRHGKLEKKRALETRNGMPWRPYVYRGTGYCMDENEAERWLAGMSDVRLLRPPGAPDWDDGVG